MSLRSVSAGQTRALRHRVLRPMQPFDATAYPGDGDAETLHVGVFLGDELASVGSVYRQPPPGEQDHAAWRLRGMATAAHHQRRGHASAALRALIGHVARLGGTRLWCNARAPAAGLYARQGFTCHGEEFDLPPIGPHYFMQRTVTAADEELALRPDPQAQDIDTARLRLRTWRPGDVEALARINADPQVARFVGPQRALTRAETQRGLDALIGHWRVHGFGLWAVEERGSGQLIGRAGLWHPPGWDEPELGWLLDRAWWGRGLATEAAAAGLAYGFAGRAMERIISIIPPDNAASQRVAGKLGMEPAGETTWRGRPVRWYARTRAQWQRGDAG